MATNFKYATQLDLKNYFNNYGDFDQKTQIFPTETSGNNHFFRDSGLVTAFFVNGSEQASPQADFDNVNGDGQWCYRADNNDLKFQASYYSSTTINEQIFESGIDFETFIDQQLVNASLELNSLLDARFSTPLEKSKQSDVDTATDSIAEEYDPVIIKATCYICASNLIRSRDPQDEDAQAYYDMVINSDGTGLIDRLNEGKIKLSSEISNTSSKGAIKYRNLAGSMDLVELYGDYYGEKYDLLRIEITTTGAYGIAKFKVLHHGNDKIFGDETAPETVTGGLQELYQGLYGRFSGSSATDGDIWEIEVYGDNVQITNSKTGSIQLHRN